MESEFHTGTRLSRRRKSNEMGPARGSKRNIGFILIFISVLLALLISVGLLMLAPDAAAQEAPEGSSQWAHSDSGVNSPARTWYFAEGATAGGYQTWILLYNHGEDGADVELTFHTDSGVVGPVAIKVGPASRTSVNVGEHVCTYNVATIVTSDLPVVASRTMYGAGGEWAHSSSGSNETSRTWYFAEGAAVGSIYDTWILLHNPGKEDAEASVVFQTDREVVSTSVSLEAATRVSIDVGDHVIGYNVATVVESDRPIVAARTMYGQSCSKDLETRVVHVAFGQLGKPYSSGASGPDAFDCSGLTQFCYKVGGGVDITHSSYSQARCGDPVPEPELQPGDIVAFHGWGHVGIYIGDGQYIHAPQTGELVEVAPLSERGDFCGAVRP
ncbi:MAG: C40 family peptidase [Actinobacteria bacterium]|nr:C40 family peptidase [Actinomycetota bacterium]MCG2818576.1 C40 family peptidase [Actinomycetes bacterium]MBU4218235.1 C40 family peptidase [Actinomycetota bacterium]MBU4358660.1 C40 family peptidase [Actinomycetota bacterium]MBU4392025.1 C40 family peptidase [Actinomycetota bacterium]